MGKGRSHDGARNGGGTKQREEPVTESANSAADVSSPRTRGLVFAACVVAIVFLVFARGLDGELLIWDDKVNFLDNVAWRGLSGEHLHWMFTESYNGPYQPLAWLTFGFEWTLWALDPFVFHLTNLLFHAATAAAFFFCARVFLRAALRDAPSAMIDWAALVAALFFAVHPLRVESVAWVTERRDVVSGLFYVLALLFWMRHLRRDETRAGDEPRIGRDALLAYAMYLLALLGKGTGMTLPFALFVLDVVPFRRAQFVGGKRALGELVVEKLPLIVLGVVFAVVAYKGQADLSKAMTSLEAHGVGARILHAFHGVATYPLMTLTGLGTSPFHPFELPNGALDPRFIGALAAVAVLVPLLWLLRAHAVLAAWLAFAVLAAPILGLFQTGPQLMADRYTYLPGVPFALLLGGVVAWAASRRPAWSTAVTAAALTACAALAVATWRLVPVWHDDAALWARVCAVYPESVTVWRSRCRSATDRAEQMTDVVERAKQLDLAESICDEACRRFEDQKLTNSLGIVHRMRADLDPEHAQQHMERALEIFRRAASQPTTGAEEPTVFVNVGLVALTLDRKEEARAAFEFAAQHFPNDLSAQLSLAQVLASLREFEAANTQFAKAAELAPRSTEILFHWGQCLLEMQQPLEALDKFRRALATEGDQPEIWYCIARAHDASGNHAAALEAAEKSVRLQVAREEAARARREAPPGDPGLLDVVRKQLDDLRAKANAPSNTAPNAPSSTPNGR